jgi:hypothetical protein
MLLRECELANVEIRVNTSVSQVQKEETHFKVHAQEWLQAKAVIVATGGPSIPKMGSTGWGYNLAKQFGLPMVEPRAALVPFTLDGKTLSALQELSGVSVHATATCGKKTFEEGLLFTHRGLSGPVILQISSYWQPGDTVEIDLAPHKQVLSQLKACRNETPKQELVSVLAQVLPKRLAHYVCAQNHYQGRMAELSNATLEKVSQSIHHWQIIPPGTEGWRTAEVALGGVDTTALSSKTFEAKNVPGLYFIGEVVDVTGHLGGYNFQWAWSSAVAAAEALGKYKNVIPA